MPPTTPLATTDLMSRTRFLKREWKRYKPHLSKSTSLPTLYLVPFNRPLFTCRQCGFANTWIALCLWCAWSSPDSTRAFEARAARGRRMSAPPRVWWHPRQSDRRSEWLAILEGQKKAKIESVVQCLEDTQVSEVDISTRTEAERDGSLLHDPSMPTSSPSRTGQIDPGEIVSHANSADDAVATATSSSLRVMVQAEDNSGRASTSTEGDVKSLRRRVRLRRGLPAAFLAAGSADDTHHAIDRDRDGITEAGDLPETTKTSSTQARTISSTNDLRRAFHLSDIPHKPYAAHDGHTSPSSSLPPLLDTQHTLRRKKPMTLTRKKSSCSLRSRASLSASQCGSNSPRNTLLSRAEQEHMRSRSVTIVSASGPDVRLGHPTRPYYTAIRKNMSRPSTPAFDSRPSSPISSHSAASHSAVTFAPPHSPTSLDGFGASVRPQRMSVPTAFDRGCSLSGEIELRMALAQRRSGDSYLPQQSFRYSDTKAEQSVKGRVRKFGTGLKNFVLGRRSSETPAV